MGMKAPVTIGFSCELVEGNLRILDGDHYVQAGSGGRAAAEGLAGRPREGPLEVPAGISWQAMTSGCLSVSGKLHIRGRLTPVEGDVAWSDLHYVIVDADVPCL